MRIYEEDYTWRMNTWGWVGAIHVGFYTELYFVAGVHICVITFKPNQLEDLAVLLVQWQNNRRKTAKRMGRRFFSWLFHSFSQLPAAIILPSCARNSQLYRLKPMNMKNILLPVCLCCQRPLMMMTPLDLMIQVDQLKVLQDQYHSFLPS